MTRLSNTTAGLSGVNNYRMKLKHAADITPVILTYNEEPNLGRTLDSLRWAVRVVIVDSGSTDATAQIARSAGNTSFFARPFDSFGGQWNFALAHTGIHTDFILALDADMVVTPAFVDELETNFLAGGFAGGVVPFTYCYYCKPLRGSLLRPQLRVFRRDAVRAGQVGHGHEFIVDGPVYRFRSGVWHDDRKSVERWLQSQTGYSRLEEVRLRARQGLRWQDHLRRSGWMPALGWILSYLRAGGPLGGKAALRYALERSTYESILALRVLDRQLAEEEQTGKDKEQKGKTSAGGGTSKAQGTED